MSRRKRTRVRKVRVAVVTAAMGMSVVPLHAPASAAPQSLRSAVPTVKRWLDHLEEGRSRKAWKLMARPTRRAIGGFQEFKDQRSAWAEGYGAWASARKGDFELKVVAPMDDDADSVVTMTGRVAREGPHRRAADALPVHTRDGTTKVDPINGNAVIRPRNPGPHESTGRKPTLKAVVKHITAKTTSVYFAVKGSRVDAQRARLRRTGPHTYVATVRWPRRLGLGHHVLTIAAWGKRDFQARTVRFKVHD
ncbi:MAG: hypothetical protein ACRDKZ_13220 [Actinomycetota bacterium]